MTVFLLQFGRAWFGVALRLLPSGVRRRASAELMAMFESRQREAVQSEGVWVLPRVWGSELAGLLRVAVSRRGRAGTAEARARRGLWIQDVRLAFRTVRRRPGQSALAIATCGLGIGGASAMFSVVNGVLLRPLPYPEPDRVVSIYPTIEEWRNDPQLRSSYERGSYAYPEFVQWRATQTVFAQAAGISGGGVLLTGAGRARSLQVGVATWELFPMLGATPVLGRTFNAADAGDTEADVILISEPFWRAQLGGNPDVIGSTLMLSGRPREIIGVLPSGFRATGAEREIWFPRGGLPDTAQLRNHDMRVVGRLADGVSIERAEAETARILRNLSEQHDELTHEARVLQRLEDQTQPVRAPLLLLMGGALLLLLAACVNFGALQLGSGMDRDSELAVRGALGAGRGRLVRHLLAESAVLAALGGVLGVMLANVLLRGLVLLAPAGIPRIAEASVDGRVVLFALLISAIAGIGFGLLPAVPLSRQDLALRLRAARTGSRARHRMHAALVVAQVALATVLLVGAGLLTRTVAGLDRTDPGFRADSLISFGIAPLLQRFPTDSGFAGAYNRYVDEVKSVVESVPGVEAVARTSILPFTSDRQNNQVEPEGYEKKPGEVLSAERNIVSGNYLDVLGARVVEGRLLTEEDDRPGAALVVVISERMARRFWPGESALGRRLTFWAGTFTIVGVIEDVHDRTLEADDDLRFYYPRASTRAQSASRFLVRVNHDPRLVAAQIQERLASWDPDLATGTIMSMRERMASSLVEHRYRARLLVCFATFAALLAVSGIYGVVARKVRQRTHEIGVRMALGAPRQDVVTGVLAQGLRVTAAGVVIGLATALGFSRVMVSYLHGVAPWDPLTLAGIAALLSIASVVACLTPSVRAARVDPMRALRAD